MALVVEDTVTIDSIENILYSELPTTDSEESIHYGPILHDCASNYHHIY